MVLPQPGDTGCGRRRAGLDAAATGIGGGLRRGGQLSGIVEIQTGVRVQFALVSL
jgi:hypothetical protein